MNLESLKSSKFEAFFSHQIRDLEKIVGGQRLAMSTRRSGGKETGADTAELTNRNGGLYDGRPGDGTAGDWQDVKWYSCSIAMGTEDDGGGCGPETNPPYGAHADLWDALSAQIYEGVVK